MAGVTVPDTPIGRDSIRRSFAWALGEIDRLKPSEGYDMLLVKRGDDITFRYTKTEGTR
jgi:hypothetical protein